MSKIFSSLIVLTVIVLVILGLNTSSQGISSLTAEDRNPVVGMQIENKQINVFAIGQEYSFSRQEISQTGEGILQDVEQQFKGFVHYLKKIWTIFNVLFLK